MIKSKREPNFENLLKVLKKERPDRPTLFEFFMNDTIYNMLTEGEFAPKGDGYDYMRQRVLAYKNAGYDYCVLPGCDFNFPREQIERSSTISLNEGCVITDRESYEKYKWPNPDDYDYSRLTVLKECLPENFKLVCQSPAGGILESTIALVGYDNLCVMTYDDPELVKLIFDEIGSRLLKYYETVVEYDTVGAIISNDDWGFNMQTMLSTDDMRKFVFPWHKKIAETAHKKNKPVILHSCGNAEKIEDDIINDMKFDGKHSYEDKILPVEQAYERYKGKLAVMGGLDVDFICRKTPEEIYDRAKAMLERSEECGGYALGTGNSVPEYVPHEKYFAMIKAAIE